MVKKKKKEREVVTRQKGPPSFQRGSSKGSGVAESDLLSCWQSVIADLQNVAFDSIEDAIERVADLVMEQLGVSHGGDPGMKEYLCLLFETDPQLKQELHEVLTIAR